MIVGSAKVTIHVPWVHSLKEKRMVVKSLCAKTCNKFNVSIAEVEEQDIHQIVVLGISAVSTHLVQTESILDEVVRFIESNTEGEVTNIEREIY
ncbi:MAG: DUF503 domain-containing protein [Anaerocolumna sp.]